MLNEMANHQHGLLDNTIELPLVRKRKCKCILGNWLMSDNGFWSFVKSFLDGMGY